MKKGIVLLLVMISVLSCKNQVKEVQVDKKAGEWVSSGTKFLMGSDEQVEMVRSLISNYAAMDAEGVFANTRDSLRFFPFNSEEPVIMTSNDVKEMFSQYDSIISDPILTNLTASKFSVKLSVTPTAMPTLSSLLANTIIIPSPNSFLPLSTSFLNSFGGNPSTF